MIIAGTDKLLMSGRIIILCVRLSMFCLVGASPNENFENISENL